MFSKLQEVLSKNGFPFMGTEDDAREFAELIHKPIQNSTDK